MINKHFGKLTNGVFSYAPIPLLDENNNSVWTNNAVLYKEQGYLPVKELDKPIDNMYYYTPVYTQEDDTIVISWKANEI